MYPTLTRRILATALIVAFTISACATAGSSSSPTAASPGPASGAAANTVVVKLQEWAVVPASTSTAAGAVTFQVTNTGPEDVHEFVVLKTDLDPAALPVDANGAVTEESSGITVVDEIEDIPVGQTQDLSVTLAAGKYVLLCNIYDETEKEAHYKMGMRIAFEATN
jgi:uncharacterized cupredoxin-like copper-binding protein